MISGAFILLLCFGSILRSNLLLQFNDSDILFKNIMMGSETHHFILEPVYFYNASSILTSLFFINRVISSLGSILVKKVSSRAVFLFVCRLKKSCPTLQDFQFVLVL